MTTTSPTPSSAQTASVPARLSELVGRHREVLDQIVAAITTREYYSRYPESPSPRVYGEEAAPAGEAAHSAHLGKRYEALADQPAPSGWVGSEVSPYGPELGVTYPHYSERDLDELLAAVRAAVPAWRDAGAEARAAICVEIIDRINARSFEMAHSVMHTTGQAFVMAFQAAGPHAQDRALEAVAYALVEQRRVPEQVVWSKPGKGEPLTMTKKFHVVPRGIGLVIGCNTFPTWNSYPGLFASLATGNGVVVKPHPRAVLPLAITVEIAREVLRENGFDPNLVVLAAEEDGEGLAKPLALRPEIGIIDYTGGPTFGTWLEQNVHQAVVYTEKAGLNTVIVDSTDNLKGLTSNLAFSFSLYSGQMCTAPQNVYVPRDGVDTDQGHLSFDEFAEALATAVQKLTGDDAKAVGILGAAVNRDVVSRADGATSLGRAVLPSRSVTHPDFPDATVRTPALVAVDASDEAYLSECFGPVAFLIATDSTAESLKRFVETVRAHGAMTASVYSTDESVLDAAEQAAMDAGVALSMNLTGGVFVNQSAAFSDFHGTGANPAANATLTDGHYVSGRFRVVQSRRHA
ncbi:MAG TPA: phenylacetic acid degradation protein PaaN [Actinomycetales bacterium]|nr:phenylacetic acid degradation protein PaaN [Actinomycetales bacterium]